MGKKYTFLKPIQIGNLQLKNRVILTPMARHLATDDGFVTEAFCEHFARIAQGGVSLVMPGICVVDSTWPYRSTRQLWLDDDKYIPGLRRFTDRIHAEGAKVGFQLWCSGLSGTSRSIDDFTLDEIHRLQNCYLSAARRCKAAGADVVEFHIAHTYLPCQFLSPAWNHRTDAYGADTVENAIRFSCECIHAIYQELCSDGRMEVIAKINGCDFVPNGITPEWCAEACTFLEREGVSLITVSGGGALGKMTDMSDNGHRSEGWKVYLAQAVKKKVHIPVAASGSIRHPEFADQILCEGKCDVIALARALHAEPDWVKKAAEGREDEMRHCISCMYCFATVSGNVSGCSINPYARRELYYKPLKKDGNKRKIAVVGAGPAGLEAAVNLAERDFSVTIFEKEAVIGGLINLAVVPPGKKKIGWLLDFYHTQIKRLGIKVITGKSVTMDDLKDFSPYAIVVATGSKEYLPIIEGIEQKHVISVRQLLRNSDCVPTGKKIAVLGGGLTGLEATYYLREQGNDVSVIEMLPLESDMDMEKKIAIGECLESGVEVFFAHKVEKITENAVVTSCLDENRMKTFPSDIIIASFGFIEENSFAAEIEKNFNQVYQIPCPRKISEAVQQGNDIAREIE